MKLFQTILSNFQIHKDENADVQQYEADAIILEFSATGIIKEQQKEIRILFHVFPRNGRNFVSECRILLDQQDELQLSPGYRLRVLIDPKHPQRILTPLFV